MTAKQLRAWRGKFGREYTERNAQTLAELDKMFVAEYEVSANEMFGAALAELPIKNVLEVGCNIGNKLALLYKLGYKDLTGVEPQNGAIKLGKKRYPFIKFRQGTIFKLPFNNSSFDLVFTSGVLIHIAPVDLRLAVKEILRVSRKFVLGFEYYSPRPTEVSYRGKTDLLWKRDFKEFYLSVEPNLNIIYSQKYFHKSGGGDKRLQSEIFVLSKL